MKKHSSDREHIKDTVLEELNKIKRVKVPDSLWLKIEAKVQHIELDKVPKKWYWMAAASLALILSLNAYFIFKSGNTKANNMQQYASEMNLNTSNQLYK